MYFYQHYYRFKTPKIDVTFSLAIILMIMIMNYKTNDFIMLFIIIYNMVSIYYAIRLSLLIDLLIIIWGCVFISLNIHIVLTSIIIVHKCVKITMLMFLFHYRIIMINLFLARNIVSIPVDNDCCVCLDELYFNVVGLDCGHSFHRNCIREWLMSIEYPGTCPICRDMVKYDLLEEV